MSKNDDTAAGCAALAVLLVVGVNVAWIGALIYLVLKIAGHL